MLSIAICDDDVIFARHLKESVISIFSVQGILCNIKSFDDAESLVESMQDEYFDIIFLDIEIKNDNGIVIGNLIRDELQNQKSQIVFVSSYSSYHHSGALYNSAPMAFIQKPFNDSDINALAEKIKSRMLQEKKKDDYFFFSHRKTKHSIRKGEIVFIECSGRKKIIHTTNGNYSFNANMSQIIDMLDDVDFALVHRSYLVNIRYIQSIDGNGVKCSTGDSIDVSAAYYKSAIHSMVEFAERQKSPKL